MKCIYKLIVLLLFTHCKVFAQLDREFWFAVPEITSIHADRPIKINLSAGSLDSYITISIPSNVNVIPKLIYLQANTNTSLDITDWVDDLENDVYNTPQNKGLLIESDNPITAYYEVLGSFNGNVVNTEIFALKGGNALGTTFYTPFQNNYDNFNTIDAWSSIDVIATEDNTIINFELTNSAFNNANNNFSIVLNRGQTYSIRNNSTLAALRFAGSKITSNKPIAVTLKDDSINKSGKESYDVVGDQIIPIEHIGIEYILFKGENFILATENNTEIYLNGTLVSVINESETYFFENSNAVYMETSKPVYVFQLTRTGFEYGGALIPHVTCTGSYNINVNRSTNEKFILAILVKNGGQDNFTVNGNNSLISQNDFAFVNGTNNEWLHFSKEFSTSEIPTNSPLRIENNDKPFHLAIISGNDNTGNRYGYFSNFNSLDLGVDFSACDNSIIEVAEGLDSYIWSTGETSNSIEIDSSGMYWVYGNEGNCEAIDTINIIVKSGINYELGNDTFICNEPVILQAPTGNDLRYEWSTLDTTSSITAENEGVYKLTIRKQNGCFDIDSIYITKLDQNDVSINDTVICDDYITIVIKDYQSNFIWKKDNDTLSTNNYFNINNPGIYTLIKNNECGVKSHSFKVEKRNILPPNIITPNGDLINDNFEIELGIGVWDFSIYNRWGKLVYESENFTGSLMDIEYYDNTYYYQLVDNYCSKSLKGYFQILR